MLVCAQCGRENADDSRFCSACGSPLGAAATEGREERKVVTILFADLVGFTSRAETARPRGRAGDSLPVLRTAPRGARAPRRYCREVHRRCGDGRLRRAGRARGRSRAGGPGGPRDLRCDRRGREAPGAGRDHDRRGARHARCGPGRGRGNGRGRRRQYGCPAAERGAGERGSRRRDDISRDAPADRLRRGRAGSGEGKGRAGPGLGSASRHGRASASTSSRPVRRSLAAGASWPS